MHAVADQWIAYMLYAIPTKLNSWDGLGKAPIVFGYGVFTQCDKRYLNARLLLKSHTDHVFAKTIYRPILSLSCAHVRVHGSIL
jgi:hypothetical protein